MYVAIPIYSNVVLSLWKSGSSLKNDKMERWKSLVTVTTGSTKGKCAVAMDTPHPNGFTIVLHMEPM